MYVTKSDFVSILGTAEYLFNDVLMKLPASLFEHVKKYFASYVESHTQMFCYPDTHMDSISNKFTHDWTHKKHTSGLRKLMMLIAVIKSRVGKNHTRYRRKILGNLLLENFGIGRMIDSRTCTTFTFESLITQRNGRNSTIWSQN